MSLLIKQTVLQYKRHNLHTDKRENPNINPAYTETKCRAVWEFLHHWAHMWEAHMRTKGNTKLTLNTCAFRYFAAGFYSTSKTAHLVQGTQVSSDAGHDNVHWCSTPTEVNTSTRDEVTNSKSMKDMETVSKGL
jgi:hypothetical protein